MPQSLVHRWTIWQDEVGHTLQVSLCVLDPSWEPLCQFTRSVGPFDDLRSERSALTAQVNRWLLETGYQQELPL